MGLQGTATDRAGLDVVLVVLPELHDAGEAAVVRMRKAMACDPYGVLHHACEGSIVDTEGGNHRGPIGAWAYGKAAPGRQPSSSLARSRGEAAPER